MQQNFFNESLRTLFDVRVRFASVACLLMLLVATSLQAEVIHIPVGQQAPENRNLPRPERGMSAETVIAKFGEPISIYPAVGEPPISRWEYSDFNVYFESQTVIHSVLTHKPKHPIPVQVE